MIPHRIALPLSSHRTRFLIHDVSTRTATRCTPPSTPPAGHHCCCLLPTSDLTHTPLSTPPAGFRFHHHQARLHPPLLHAATVQGRASSLPVVRAGAAPSQPSTLSPLSSPAPLRPSGPRRRPRWSHRRPWAVGPSSASAPLQAAKRGPATKRRCDGNSSCPPYSSPPRLLGSPLRRTLAAGCGLPAWWLGAACRSAAARLLLNWLLHVSTDPALHHLAQDW
ncbi:hypothetical protein DAI22_03g244400 [Oryza sativa Japonica Group]|nr:hypothetical protein DAI22_03g244400 [Oryza sativa Japonica Group]KAF2940088.1 hypothetical protein DAI22_03g244400 [Oryza sativa Japonica Group]